MMTYTKMLNQKTVNSEHEGLLAVCPGKVGLRVLSTSPPFFFLLVRLSDTVIYCETENGYSSFQFRRLEDEIPFTGLRVGNPVLVRYLTSMSTHTQFFHDATVLAVDKQLTGSVQQLSKHKSL